jgi:hypothetical protein
MVPHRHVSIVFLPKYTQQICFNRKKFEAKYMTFPITK